MNNLIGKVAEFSVDGGTWIEWGVIETLAQATAIAERIKMGSHAIVGGQHLTQYRIKEEGDNGTM